MPAWYETYRRSTQKVRNIAANLMKQDWFAILVIVIEIAIGVSAAAMLYAVWLNM